jgi:hypothetical protein
MQRGLAPALPSDAAPPMPLPRRYRSPTAAGSQPSTGLPRSRALQESRMLAQPVEIGVERDDEPPESGAEA